MTVPNADDGPAPPHALTAPADATRGRFLLARKWAYLVSSTAYLPLTHSELEQHMLHLVNRLFDTIRREPFDPEAAGAVGTRLVEMKCVGPDSIRRTVDALGRALLHQPELAGVDRLAERVVLVLGAMMTGYAERLRQVTQQRQEELNRSLHKVAEDARRTHLIGHARFEEVFRSSSSGVALVGLDKRIGAINEAMAGIVLRSEDDLIGLSLFDLIAPQDAGSLGEAYERLESGGLPHLESNCQVVRGDGAVVPMSFSASLVRDADGAADHFVTVVEAESDLAGLRRSLSELSRHDALTGLLNRQAFRAALQAALSRSPVTLYHLDIDGFSLINAGLGAETGDRLLVSVAERLRSVVAQEKAAVGRLGADEFGIVVENTAESLPVLEMVGRIQQVLDEPVYLDGEHGLAAPVCIGVVDRPGPGTAPADVLRAAETTLRRAKDEGRRQWQLFDPPEDARQREMSELATSMAAAWETGAIKVAFRTVTRLDTRRQAGVEAVSYWDHPRRGPLSHADCVKLAERTGLGLSLGYSLLSEACARRAESDDELPLSVPLTIGQAADPDLVGVVRRVLGETGLNGRALELGFPAEALAAEHGETADNLCVLADIGVRTAIHDFGAARDAIFLEDLRAGSIRLAPVLVARQRERPGPDSAITPILTGMVAMAHRSGATVSVDGVGTPEQADFWRRAGADFALGELFDHPG
ncbi:EAL domain-containing protein [Amycolatopsis pigmentata]|uniref:EAL domain-containing protein n=1 Tax=Amycolatopsis pigmentata TaxID=450801 RepID=A0ABW5FTP5_9PSEU